MRRIAVSTVGLWLAIVATIAACGGRDREAPKFPLRPAGAVSSDVSIPGSRRGISGDAKIALDSANMLFRAKAYDRALAQYRRSSQLAPTELAPLFGILMVTDVTKDKKLADSTLARMHQLDPRGADSLAAMSHADIVGVHAHQKKPTPVPRA